jgi:fatty acid desaturase
MPPRRSRVLSRLSETFWILVLAVVVLFAFFLLLGAFTPGDGLTLTIVVALLGVLWVAHAVWASRHRDPHDRAVIRARERRGF